MCVALPEDVLESSAQSSHQTHAYTAANIKPHNGHLRHRIALGPTVGPAHYVIETVPTLPSDSSTYSAWMKHRMKLGGHYSIHMHVFMSLCTEMRQAYAVFTVVSLHDPAYEKVSRCICRLQACMWSYP